MAEIFDGFGRRAQSQPGEISEAFVQWIEFVEGRTYPHLLEDDD